MRGFAGVVLLLFVGALGCSETTASGGAGGDGGSAGSGGWIGNCGPHGFGGGAAFLAPGLWRNNPGGQEEDVCFYVNEDCTRLVPSTECDIGEDDEAAHLLEIQWANGLNESGEQCAARLAVTEDLATEAPIRTTSFRFNVTDAEGAEWVVNGGFASGEAHVHARRSEGGGYCEVADYPGIWASPPGLY
jgi:hypothetical protein